MVAPAAFGDPRLSGRERIALEYTDTFWHDHTKVGPELISRMLAEFEPSEIIEIGVLVSQFIGMGKLFAVLGIPNPAGMEN